MLSIIRHRPHTGQNNTCLPRDMYVDETQDTHAQHRHTGKTHRWHVDTSGPFIWHLHPRLQNVPFCLLP